MAAPQIYRVEQGDTLSEIAKKYGTTVSALANLNNISNPDYIVVGQEIQINGDKKAETVNTTYKATIEIFGLQSNTDRTIFASWKFNKENTENYRTIWYYYTGDGVWFVGNDSTTEFKHSTYTAPSNATRVKFKVKPIAKKKSSFGTNNYYWEGAWSTVKIYNFSDNPPTTPPVPTVTIEGYQLTASLSNLNVNAEKIEFQIVRDDTYVFKKGTSLIKTRAASYSCKISVGSSYKVRCRSIRDDLKSSWSEYSANSNTQPSPPKNITVCRASSATAVYLEWSKSKTAVTYDIEYATKKEYFDTSNQTTTVNGAQLTKYEISGLETGSEYFFRVRAVNNSGTSSWTKPKSVVIGKKPAAPTTWSSTTTVMSGDPLNLYWVHNSEDGSSQTYAELELIINGVTYEYTIRNSTDEDEKDKTSVYSIDTVVYDEGVTIQWRVRTAGVTNTYGEWSVQRTVDIYAPPNLQLEVTGNDGNELETLTSFPFYIYGLAGPSTQEPIGYYLTVISEDSYETVDNIGNTKIVNVGDQVYSKHYDTSDPLVLQLSAGDLDLENNVRYTVNCIASMNSGLNAEASTTFTVAWEDVLYEPNAEVIIDYETFTASIRPHCEDENGIPIQNMLLSVYRREYDGKFTELATGIDNLSNTFITDPHPSLDFARYRIVGISTTTGAVSHGDIPGIEVGGKAVIIQWSEDWSTFDVDNEDIPEQPLWAGSMLKLPYNIDVSDSHKNDVALIEYIGREHPISYYGTQRGETSTWNVEIEKSDKETLYAIRRLAKWMGDVYVREPSGVGYWANISVSFSQKHCDLTIPVTFNIARVEGGM